MMTTEVIRREIDSDQATERDLAVLDALIAGGVELTTSDWTPFMLVADKVIDDIPMPEVQLALREFLHSPRLVAADGTGQFGEPASAMMLSLSYAPNRLVSLTYKTVCVTRKIELSLAPIFSYLAPQNS
jgi:hypothetical protein